nr:SDR family oxidoreductase [uncultured Carboxylicivirga sp.]
MILITGATGNLGYLTITELLKLKPAKDIAVLVRKESEKSKALTALGVDVRIGDYSNYDSLLQAFEQIETLFFVSTHEAAQNLAVHGNVIKASIKSGVRRIVYTSTQGDKTQNTESSSSADLHAWTESEIKNSGLNYTILRNAPYMESLPLILGEKVLEIGFSMPAGDGKLSFAARTDMAIASAKVLNSEGHNNKTYEFGGTKSYGYKEILAILSDITNKELSYISPEPEIYKKQCEDAGIPEPFIAANLGFATQVKDGYFDHPTQDLAIILGREPVSVKTFLKKIYK